MIRPRIAIFSEDEGWHEARLAAACRRRGAAATVVSLRGCVLSPVDDHAGLAIAGFEDGLPDAAFVRCIPAGSFEQVTRRLDVLHALSLAGVAVINDAGAIERTIDKGMTSWCLARAGVPTPPAWTCESPEQAARIRAREHAAGHDLVLKPLFGNRGRGLLRLARGDPLPAPIDGAGVYYLQRFVDSAAPTPRDWRVMVIGGEAVAAMERIGTHWITNRARGASCNPAPLTAVLRERAEAAVAALGAAYAGVDVIREPGGEHLVLEVNSIPAWSGLQAVASPDIAGRLMGVLLARLKAGRIEAAS